MFERGTGNLLEADVDALVNTVNTVGIMGKGIALQFRRAFPEMFDAYEKACKANEVVIGRMFVVDRHTLIPPRYIINFPTKRHWKGKSRLVDIEAGLTDLIKCVKELGIKSIAIPPLGCGNGGLNWADVRPLIIKAFANISDVRVLLFAPGNAPEPEEMPNKTTPPNMTHNRAAIIGIMSRYAVLDYRLSILEVQKLAYFLQQAGQPLRLKFEKAQYGPYADNLRKSLRNLEGHFISGFGDGSNNRDAPISVVPAAVEEANRFLAEDTETKNRFDRVASLIEGFETAYGLELLATVHWAAKESSRTTAANFEDLVKTVHSWNDRKMELMLPDHIMVAWRQLKEQEWL
jgi:O-acetyl-ADP-ribose deacetylase (regulator of RNase III)